jgi:hypothetical protein
MNQWTNENPISNPPLKLKLVLNSLEINVQPAYCPNDSSPQILMSAAFTVFKKKAQLSASTNEPEIFTAAAAEAICHFTGSKTGELAKIETCKLMTPAYI